MGECDKGWGEMGVQSQRRGKRGCLWSEEPQLSSAHRSLLTETSRADFSSFSPAVLFPVASTPESFSVPSRRLFHVFLRELGQRGHAALSGPATADERRSFQLDGQSIQ